jgi:hypothetical protein
MKRTIILAIPLLFVSPAAFAGSASGNGALSLAALVAEHSPAVTRVQKWLLRAYLDGRASARFRAGSTIVVKADEATCRISDVDITYKDCRLTFGPRTVTLAGRQAHELYATLIEVGVPSSGAAGSIYESVKQLKCTILPAQVRDRAGGGASCNFTANP